MFVSVTRGIFVLCHHVIVNLFVRKPELNGANLPNFDLNSCHFCPSFFCPPTVLKIIELNVRIAIPQLVDNKQVYEEIPPVLV
jgi:hypothetical protein